MKTPRLTSRIRQRKLREDDNFPSKQWFKSGDDGPLGGALRAFPGHPLREQWDAGAELLLLMHDLARLGL